MTTNQPIIWRKWLLIVLMISVISIQIIESSHDHLSQAAQESCPVCQIIAHQPVDTGPTALIKLALVLPVLVILPFRRKTTRLVETFFRSYFSRAPPSLFA